MKSKSKSRRVFVTLEIETEMSLVNLRKKETWLPSMWRGGDRIIQVQLNVSKPESFPARDAVRGKPLTKP